MSKVNSYREKVKKTNSTILRARLKGDKFECEEEREAVLEVLKLRGVDVSAFVRGVVSESEAPIEIFKEVPTAEVENSLDDAADNAYESICEENDQEKVKLLAKLLDRGDGTSRDWSELAVEDKNEIIRISKLESKPNPKSPQVTKSKVTTSSGSEKSKLAGVVVKAKGKEISLKKGVKREQVVALLSSGKKVEQIVEMGVASKAYVKWVEKEVLPNLLKED